MCKQLKSELNSDPELLTDFFSSLYDITNHH